MSKTARSYGHAEVVDVMRVAAEYGWLVATYGRREEANEELARETDRWRGDVEKLLASYDEEVEDE